MQTKQYLYLDELLMFPLLKCQTGPAAWVSLTFVQWSTRLENE